MKSKKLLSVLLVTILLLSFIPLGTLSISASTYGNLTYELSNGKVTITDCDTSASGEMVIPSTIEGYPVTTIGERAFESCQNLTSVTIPDGVITIGGMAFYRCRNLTKVTIPASIRNIGGNAFNTSGGAISVYITDLAAWSNITYSNSLGNPLSRSGDLYLNGELVTDLVIPDGVTTIGEYAFMQCNNLISVTIPDGVTTIKSNAFAYCPNLTSVIISDSVTSIGYAAFIGCTSLNAIDMPNVGISIGSRAFDETGYYNNPVNWVPQYCSELKALYIDRHLIRLTLPELTESWYGTYEIQEDTLSIAESALDPFNVYSGVLDVRIPTSVTCIESQSSVLDVSVRYDGNQTEWDIITQNADYLDLNVFCDGRPFYDPNVQHSVMDTKNGNGLAFRFELTAKGVVRDDRNVIGLTNATIHYLGKDCKLIGMGAVLTNSDAAADNLTLDAVNDFNVVDIPTVYLQEADEDSCAFATRITNIPDNQLERTIYARPYYVVEVDGEQITVYGDVDAASCAEYL